MGKRRFLSFLTTVLAVLLLASGHAWAEKRVALVIGNSAYRNAPLANPVNDAKLMATTLRGLGFDVLESLDVDQRALKRAVTKFGDKLEAAGKDAVGLFYYAGHGVQIGGTNYLIPIGAEINREKDVDIEAVSANAVLANMEFAGNRVNIVIMDACRNNPYKRSFRSAARGLAEMSATAGTLIAYATGPGDVAADGSGANSPYTLALSRAMNTSGLTVERMFKQVRNAVRTETNERQTPWESSSLTGADFYFTPKASTETPPAPEQTAALTPGPAQEKTTAPSDDSFELVFWNSIEDGTDPEEYRAYLKKYPEGRFAALAQARINKFTRTAEQKEKQIQVAATETEPSVSEPPEVEPVAGDYFSVKLSNVRAAPTTASAKIGMVKPGQELDILGKVRNRNWYLLGRDGQPYGYVYGNLIAALSPTKSVVVPERPAPQQALPPPVRPEGVRVFNVQPVVHGGKRLDRLTAIVQQQLSNVPDSMVVSEPGKTAPEDTVVRTVITRLDSQVVSNPEYLASQVAGALFGYLGRAMAQSVPEKHAIFTANVVITARNQKTGRVITEDGLAEHKIDALRANKQMIEEALVRATQEAMGRLVIRLIGGVPPDRAPTAPETDKLVEDQGFVN